MGDMVGVLVGGCDGETVGLIVGETVGDVVADASTTAVVKRNKLPAGCAFGRY